jgi:hypothetical protein
LVKAALQLETTGEVLPFTFNPTSVVLHKSANWSGTPAPRQKGSPTPQYVGASPATVTFTVLYDAWSAPDQDVAAAVTRLTTLTCPLPVPGGDPQPPLLRLQWGTVCRLLCFVKEVNATYLLFDEQGTPLRATVDLTLQETPEPPRPQNPTSGGPPGTRARTVVAGDTLASLAQEAYGDPGLWRALAEANGIDDPMRLPPGRPLLLPPAAAARALLAPGA